MDAVAHVQQPFDGVVIRAVRTVGKPGCGERGHQYGVAQTTACLFDVRLVDVGHAAEFVEARFGGAEQFRQTFACGLAPSFQYGYGCAFDKSSVPRDRHHVQPSHGCGQVAVGDGLALRDGTYRLVEVEAGIPNRIPQFVGELVELLVGQRVRLVDDRQIKVGAGAHLSTCQRTDRAETDAGCRHVEGNRLAGFVPQLCEIAHGQFRAGFAFRRAIAVDAVGVGLAHGHEPLFETIDC